MFKTKKLSAISIASLMLLSTLFSCSFTDREKVDFVKEEKIHELNKMKDLISDNVEDFSSIDDIFNRYDNSALCRAVQLCKHNSRDIGGFVEQARLVYGILSRCCVKN